jgi:hypothetical protein
MGSTWTPYADAVRALGDNKVDTFSGELVSRLRNGDIASRADTLSYSTLTFLPIFISEDKGSEKTYIAFDDLLDIEHRQLLELKPGRYHIQKAEKAFTVIRKEDEAILYWQATPAKQQRRVELTGGFWKAAVLDSPSSFGISDDLHSLTRSAASGISLNSADLSHFWPMLFGQEARSNLPGNRPRKTKYDWEGAKVELRRFVSENRITFLSERGVQAAMENHVLAWFLQKYKKEPHRSQVRTFVKNFMLNY